MFLRAKSVRDLRFDESLGVGSGTAWGAGEATDYLLRLLNRDASIYYEPALKVFHPSPVPPYDAKARFKAYSYGSGMGRVLHTHEMPMWFKGKVAGEAARRDRTVSDELQAPQGRLSLEHIQGQVEGYGLVKPSRYGTRERQAPQRFYKSPRALWWLHPRFAVLYLGIPLLFFAYIKPEGSYLTLYSTHKYVDLNFLVVGLLVYAGFIAVGLSSGSGPARIPRRKT